MTNKDKIEKLKSFKSEKDFREFLIELLKKVGFQNVIHSHRYGNPEFGKDIIATYEHDFEGTENYSFVVKKGHISAGTNEIETIKNQINQSFEYPYIDLNRDRFFVQKTKVVTNENFTDGGQRAITQSDSIKNKANVSFLWNETLIPLIDKYFPDFWLPGEIEIKEYSKSLKHKIENEFEIKELSLQKIEDSKVKKLLGIFIEPQLTEITVNESDDKQKKIKRSKVSISSVINSKDNFIFNGEPGCGKTKVINTITCEFVNSNSIIEKNVFPIRLNIYNLRKFSFDLEETIKNNLRLYIPEYFEKIDLKNFEKVLLIDSIDLLKKEEQSLLIKRIEDYCSNEKARFILSQRSSNNIDVSVVSNGIREVKINNFNVKQVESFISKYFEGTDRGNKFLDILKESNILSKLPTTPLTVTLLALLYDDQNYEVPATLTDIYNDFTQILLGKLEIKNRQDNLLFNIRKRIFSSVALHMLDNHIFEMPYEEFKNYVNNFLESKSYEIQDDEGIKNIIFQSGLLYIDEEDNVGFKQQAFIDYFSSIEIYNHKRRTHYKKLLKNFNKVNWQNTAIFFAGISKDLPDMVDDLLMYMPNNELGDYLINSGGMGYLSQALYLTDKEERKKLIYKSLDNLVNSFYEIKKLTSQKSGFAKDMSLPLITIIINYWFTENFKSITLKNTLIEVYDEIAQSNSSDNIDAFVPDFKLFMIASTLMNKYISVEEKFEELVDRNSFIKNPLLMIAGDMFLEFGDYKRDIIKKDVKEKIDKSVRQHRKFLMNFIKEPAYRFGDDYKMIDNKE